MLKPVNWKAGKGCNDVPEEGKDFDVGAFRHEDRAQTLNLPTETVGLLAESGQGEVLHQMRDAVIYEALVGKAHPKDQAGTNGAGNLGHVDRKLAELEALYPFSARSRTLVKCATGSPARTQGYSGMAGPMASNWSRAAFHSSMSAKQKAKMPRST